MMRFRTFRWLGFALAMGGGSLACGSVDPGAPEGAGGGGSEAGDSAGGDSANPRVGEPLLPFAVGNSWTYRVTKDGLVSTKQTTVGALEMIGGDGPQAELEAYRVTTAKDGDSNDHTESWQGPSPDEPRRIVRYREQSFDASSGQLELDEYWAPHKLHVDGSAAHTLAGASWLEAYAETKLAVGSSPVTHDVRERWTVLDEDSTLEVPAGVFQHVIHLQKVGSSTTKDYWYAPGVGKLKETGSQTEELSDYSLQDER